MRVGDLVREWVGGNTCRTGIVVAIDPLRYEKVIGPPTGDAQNEVVIWLTTGLQTYADPRRWEVISEGG